MDTPVLEHHTYLSHPTRRNRLVSFLLAAAVTVLLALLMLAIGALGPEKTKTPANLVAVQLPPEQSGSKATHARTPTKQAAAAPHPQHTVAQQPVVKPPVPVSPFLHLSKEEFAASDISKLGHASDGGGSTGSGSSSTYGPGDGPGGQQLYNAEWYREPTNAEMSTYTHQTGPGVTVGEIACKTAEHYHVEDCQELNETPLGSGMARSMRQAAWQFLIVPPRINGHPVIGAWVRIKYTLTISERPEPVYSLPGADNGP